MRLKRCVLIKTACDTKTSLSKYCKLLFSSLSEVDSNSMMMGNTLEYFKTTSRILNELGWCEGDMAVVVSKEDRTEQIDII